MSKKTINIAIMLGVSLFLFPSLSKAVTLTVGNGSGYRGSDNNPVGMSLSNPSDVVKKVQVEVCDADDYLSVLSCTTTGRSSDGFTCQVFPLPSGCARIILSSPGGLISGTAGEIYTINYNVSASAPSGQNRALTMENIFVYDEFNNILPVTPFSGSFSFMSCTAGTQCEDGLYCNGDEGCSGGACTHTGDPCPGGECETCQEDTDSCFDPYGTPCTDDGLYCTGEEICDGIGSCEGLDPCPDATCVEADDKCTCNLPGEDCNDGLYCTGEDYCFFGDCVRGDDPCPSQGVDCDEEVNRCECLVDAVCDDENPCTDDSCGGDGTCRYFNNSDPCDDGIYCNGDDTCGCGICIHQGDPCSSPLVCDEDASQCSSSQAEIQVLFGSGVIGTTDRLVNVQLKNPSRFVNGITLEVCDENDYLIVSSCEISQTNAPNYSCSVNELENGCALVVLTPPSGGTPQPIVPDSNFRTICNIGYDVGLCVTRATDCNNCGTECNQEGITCSAGSPDCYRFDRNKLCNCDESDCYSLTDPCLPVDTGDIWLTPENLLVLDTSDNPLRALPVLTPFPNFEITCDQNGDCASGSVCANDTCSGGSCIHTPSGVTFCDDGLYCTDTDQCDGVECIGEGDTCGSIFLCDETGGQCLSCTNDSECDGVIDGSDNCVDIPNGPDGGVCTKGTIGEPCLEHCDCGLSLGYCSMTQEDSFPPDGNNLGDACDCEGNFDCDQDVDGSDAQGFKNDFGRSQYQNPCGNDAPCNGDFDCDVDVDGTDAQTFKNDFGRSQYKNPCPSCVVGEWCAYP